MHVFSDSRAGLKTQDRIGCVIGPGTILVIFLISHVTGLVLVLDMISERQKISAHNVNKILSAPSLSTTPAVRDMHFRLKSRWERQLHYRYIYIPAIVDSIVHHQIAEMSAFIDDPLCAHLLPYLEEARRLHAKYPLCDGHNDFPWFLNRLEPPGPYGLNDMDLEVNHKGLAKIGPAHGCQHTDLVRLAQGGVGWQFWSVFVPITATGAMAVQMTLEQIDIVKRMARKYPSRLEMAYCADDVERIFKDGKIASMCGMEGGHQINGSMGTLRMMYDLGNYMYIGRIC